MNTAWRLICLPIVLVLVFSLAAFTVIPVSANLGGLVNGGFEAGNLSGWTVGGLE